MAARDAADALLGLDEIVRYFVITENPSLENKDFEIPVLVNKGSWVAMVVDISTISAGIVGTAYLSTAATNLAKNDFKDMSSKDMLKKALDAALWILRIGKHVGGMEKRKFEKVKFREQNQLVGIPNIENKYLYVPKNTLDLFNSCPTDLFSRVSSLIEEDRELIIGTGHKEEQMTTVTVLERNIFISEKDGEVIFPEMQHGQKVEVEGIVTRGNEKANTIGLEYRGHILSCKPKEGAIALYKEKILSKKLDHIYPKVKMVGIVDRSGQFGLDTEKKPKIIFSEINPLDEGEDSSLKLI